MSTSRQLTIKTGVVNRLVKEVQSYKDEATLLEGRVKKMEEDKKDEYEVRNQKRVHADAVQMIPDSEKRLAKAIDELDDLLNSAATADLGEEDEIVVNAKKALTGAKARPSN